MRAWLRPLVTLAAAGLAYLIAWGVSETALARAIATRPADFAFLADEVPLPHHVPEFQGGLSLRFAMVHDVIHERFAAHGPAFYEERNRLAREYLANLLLQGEGRLDRTDDLATGLERLGKSAEAEVVMRTKLAEQRGRGKSGRDLYTTYANLGTFLIHGSLPGAMAGDPDARRKFAEGVDFIRKSVEVNPEAHFGRERWQASIAGFLLAAMGDPGLLRTFDCLGNRLDRPMAEMVDHNLFQDGIPHARPADTMFRSGEAADELPAYFKSGAAIDDPARWPEFRPIRRHITKIGAEGGWADVAGPSNREPAPFDEPTLGIIGMWRQGGGANPHFALALGETMLRVGQRRIAWTAFERASRMADRFWPDPAVRQGLVDHCRKRQGEIAVSFAAEPRGATGPEAPANLRSQFEGELARGEEYRALYRLDEADRIAAGIGIRRADFHARFEAENPPIASTPGPEEYFRWVPPGRNRAYASAAGHARGCFAAGLAALTTSLIWRAARVRRPVASLA